MVKKVLSPTFNKNTTNAGFRKQCQNRRQWSSLEILFSIKKKIRFAATIF